MKKKKNNAGEQSELQKVVGSNNTNMTIEALEPYTRYKIFMQAYSGEVSSLPSLSIEQTTGETCKPNIHSALFLSCLCFPVFCENSSKFQVHHTSNSENVAGP